MTNDWKKVYTSQNSLKSEIVKQVLVDNEIEAVVLNKQGYPYNIGEVEVYVNPTNYEQALKVIENGDL